MGTAVQAQEQADWDTFHQFRQVVISGKRNVTRDKTQHIQKLRKKEGELGIQETAIRLARRVQN